MIDGVPLPENQLSFTSFHLVRGQPSFRSRLGFRDTRHRGDTRCRCAKLACRIQRAEVGGRHRRGHAERARDGRSQVGATSLRDQVGRDEAPPQDPWPSSSGGERFRFRSSQLEVFFHGSGSFSDGGEGHHVYSCHSDSYGVFSPTTLACLLLVPLHPLSVCAHSLIVTDLHAALDVLPRRNNTIRGHFARRQQGGRYLPRPPLLKHCDYRCCLLWYCEKVRDEAKAIVIEVLDV